MKIHSIVRIATLALAGCLVIRPQSPPVITGGGYSFPAPLNLAPGQLVSLYVTGVPVTFQRTPDGVDLVTEMAGVSVRMEQLSSRGLVVLDLPILEIRALRTCFNPILASICVPDSASVTIQAPFEMEPYSCPDCGAPTIRPRVEGVRRYIMEVHAVPDQIHIVRDFDSILPVTLAASLDLCTKSTRNDNMAPTNFTALPCPPIVRHADGSLVSADNPAKAGEELTAIATGLGHTSPLGETGKIVKASAQTITQFTMDFNYRPNALATRPLPPDGLDVALPLYTGSLAASVGLYEVRFIVPPVPPGTPPCAPIPRPNFPGGNKVYSNLTFSIGGESSFDGAGICVAVDQSPK